MSIEPLERAGRSLEAVWRRWRHDVRRAWAPDRQIETSVFAAALLLLVVSVICGGASQTNALSLMAVELASLPLLMVSTYLVLAGAAPNGSAFVMALLAAMVALPALQIIPLPFELWRHLPGRGIEVQALAAAGLGRPSLPFSLAPQQTWRALLALAPPTAMFLGGLMLQDGQRRLMAALWLGLAVIGLGLGALQMLSGPDSALYLYSITNAGSPVGFFSNRNHQAALLVCLMPVAAVFAARFDGRFDSPRLFPALAAALYVFIAIVGVAATRSRAGIGLTALALAGVAVLVLRGDAVRRHWRASAALAAGVALAIGGVLAVGLGPISQRFESGGEPRFEGWPVALQAAQTYLPLGAGVGSFASVYSGVEPLDQVSPILGCGGIQPRLKAPLRHGVARQRRTMRRRSDGST